uniref:Uncharacterized protein n=1 Tax=Spongospora subterranea TaxID=70186 RepID=A0A0H5QZ01_9EUKA|eukprot:CRZ07213.1 hypothetical protein [Spongospora subterranea]
MMMGHHCLPEHYEELDELFFEDEELLDDHGDFEEIILDEEIELDEIRHGYMEPQLTIDQSFTMMHQPYPQQSPFHIQEPAQQLVPTPSEQYFPPEPPAQVKRFPTHELAPNDQVLMDMGLIPTFQWIGNLECFLVDHGRFCEAYEENTQQLENGPVPGICCFTLSSNTNLDLEIEHDDDGITMIFIKNSYTTGLIGVIPSVFSVVLIPLIRSGLIRVAGKIETLIHPENCPPPFKLILSGNMSAISNGDNFDPTVVQALVQLRRWLKRPKGVFIAPELPANINQVRKVLNRPEKKRLVSLNGDQSRQPSPQLVESNRPSRTAVANTPLVINDLPPSSLSRSETAPARSRSTMELLNHRRQLRNRREIEQCRTADVPRLMKAIRHESKSWTSIERVETIVNQFVECRDPLSCIGRLLGATMALSSLPHMGSVLQEGWNIVMSGGKGGPVMAPSLRRAIQQLLDDLRSQY